MKCSALLLFVVLTANLARAQAEGRAQPQEPTYDQTQKWIVSKLSEGGYTRNTAITRDTASYDKISLDDCRLLYTQTEFYLISSEGPSGTETGETTTRWETAIPLSKVEASDISVRHNTDRGLGMDEWSVNINSHVGTMRMIKTKRGIVGEEIKNYGNVGGQLIFGRSPTTDEDIARRMEKALNYAVSLCKKMNEKEPF